MWAHTGLIDFLTAAPVPTGLRATEPPVNPYSRDYGLWWEAAQDEQARLAGRSEFDAKDDIQAMVDLVLLLAAHSSWWGNRSLRAKAIGQIVWRTVTGDQVGSSAAAHDLWSRDRMTGVFHSGPHPRQRPAVEAWEQWAAAERP
jgi:hypothetical protein